MSTIKNLPIAAPALKRADAPTSTPIVSTVAPVAEVSTPQAPENLFGTRSKALDNVTGPDGKAVSQTATPAALYATKGISSAKPPLAALGLRNLSPAQVKTKQAELTAKKEKLEVDIQGRTTELDGMWKTMGAGAQSEALKGYLSGGNSLSTETRADVEGRLAKSETAYAASKTLAAEGQKLGPSKGPNAGTPEERKALAAKIWAARHERTTEVSAATAAIDQAGLKVERLVATEANIDPSQGATSKYGSMSGLVGELFHTTFMLDTLNKLYFSPFTTVLEEMQRESKDNDKQRDLEKREIEKDWAGRDQLMRDLMKGISTKDVEGKRTQAKQNVAGRTGDVGRMTAVDLANKLRS